MEPSFAEYRLPRGRHGLSPELVKANQRWRLLGACAEVLSRRGYARTGVAEVTAAAAVSKATFYRNFDGLPGCILATFELAAKNVLAVVERGCRDDGDDGPDLGAILSVVLAFFEAEPALACVLTDGALDDVPGLPAARAEFTARCSQLLVTAGGAGRSGGSHRRAQYLVGGLQGWLAMRLAADEGVACPQELAEFLSL